MKKFSEIRNEARNLTEQEELLEAVYDQKLPVVLILRRKSIRIYPDGIKVGLYYSDRLKKFVTIPFSENETDIKVVGTD